MRIEALNKWLSNAEALVRPNVITFLNVSSTSSPIQARNLVFAHILTSKERTKTLFRHANRFKMLNNALSFKTNNNKTSVSLLILHCHQQSLETAPICTSIEDRSLWLLCALRLLQIHAQQTPGASFSTWSIPVATLESAHISTSTEVSKGM